MVVDGTVEFVGSRTQQARESILKAAGKTKTPVVLAQGNADGTSKGNLSAKVGKLEGTTKGDAAEVWLAITETGLHSSVTRGENAGEDLHHAAVVRFMRKIGEAKAEGETSFAGDISIPLQKGWKRENLRPCSWYRKRRAGEFSAPQRSVWRNKLRESRFGLEVCSPGAVLPEIHPSQVLSGSTAKGFTLR